MIDSKNSNTKPELMSTVTTSDFEQTLLNLSVYKELDENPNQNLDLVTHIKNQLQQLKSIHQRKMFLIKEIGSVRSR